METHLLTRKYVATWIDGDIDQCMAIVVEKWHLQYWDSVDAITSSILGITQQSTYQTWSIQHGDVSPHSKICSYMNWWRYWSMYGHSGWTVTFAVLGKCWCHNIINIGNHTSINISNLIYTSWRRISSLENMWLHELMGILINVWP